MSIEALKNKLSDHAKDIKLNIANVLSLEGASPLTLSQLGGIQLAVAFTLKNQTLIQFITSEVEAYLTNAEIDAAKSAAIIMAMNNIYYRFIHLVSDSSFATMPAKLRMNVLGNPGIDKVNFELNCLAVSVINGCGMCIDAHANTLLKSGVSKLAIQSTVRIAAVLNAAALGIEV